MKESNPVPFKMAADAIAGIATMSSSTSKVISTTTTTTGVSTTVAASPSKGMGKESEAKLAEKALLESLMRAKEKKKEKNVLEGTKNVPGDSSMPSVKSTSANASASAANNGMKEASPPSLKQSSTTSTAKESPLNVVSTGTIATTTTANNITTPAPATVASSGSKVFVAKAKQLLKKAALALGPSHAIVENQSDTYVCIITFNKSGILLSHYSNLYVIDPTQKMRVEAIPDPVGLFVCIVYKASEG